jgi:hypothetical protein
MKEKSVIIIALSMIMLSFIASSFDGSETITGNIVVENSECSADLYLLNGKYVIPCKSGNLIWDDQQLLTLYL